MIKALVIDLDGTMYPKASERRADIVCMDRIYGYMGMMGKGAETPKRKDPRVRMMVEKYMTSELVAYLSKKFRLSEAKMARYVFGIDPSPFGIREDRKLASLLSKLSQRYELWVLTNANPDWVRSVLGILGLKGIFGRRIVSMKQLGRRLKPNPHAFRKFLSVSKLRRRDILFIDDKPANVKSARGIGIRSVLAGDIGSNKGDSLYSILERIANDRAPTRQRR